MGRIWFLIRLFPLGRAAVRRVERNLITHNPQPSLPFDYGCFGSILIYIGCIWIRKLDTATLSVGYGTAKTFGDTDE